MKKEEPIKVDYFRISFWGIYFIAVICSAYLHITFFDRKTLNKVLYSKTHLDQASKTGSYHFKMIPKEAWAISEKYKEFCKSLLTNKMTMEVLTKSNFDLLEENNNIFINLKRNPSGRCFNNLIVFNEEDSLSKETYNIYVNN